MKFRGGESWYDRTVLLAPPLAALIAPFQEVQADYLLYDSLLGKAQQLRARVYLQDGAIEPHQLSTDGRLIHPLDQTSWHLVVLNSNQEVSGCLRYSLMDFVSFYHLEVARSPLAYSQEWSVTLRRAIEAKRAGARRRGISYVEVGGWALAEEIRGTGDALRMALTTYALTQFLGGAIATTTATRRHQSSTILKKLGGEALTSDGQQLPPYYDPQYRCEMEILGFDSNRPNPKYRGWIERYRRDFPKMTVVCDESHQELFNMGHSRPAKVNAAHVPGLRPVLLG